MNLSDTKLAQHYCDCLCKLIFPQNENSGGKEVLAFSLEINLTGDINTFHSDKKTLRSYCCKYEPFAISTDLFSLQHKNSFWNINRFGSISVAKNVSFLSVLLYEGRRVNLFHHRSGMGFPLFMNLMKG